MFKNKYCKEPKTLLSYVFPDSLTDKEKDEQAVPAEKIAEAMIEGKDIDIRNGVIEGEFLLDSGTIKGRVTIQRTKFKGRVDWRYSTFERVLRLENSTFEEAAIFTSATFEQDIYFEDATFEGEAVFLTTRIESDAVFSRAKFKGRVIFNGAQIDGSAFFNNAKFRGDGEVNFTGVRIRSAADFQQAKFEGRFSFNGAKIDGSAFFNNAKFRGKDEVNFGNARVGRDAEFHQAKFEGGVSFNGARIEGSAFFEEAKFRGKDEVNFIGARVGGEAEFRQAEFASLVLFDDVHIESKFSLRKTTFNQYVSFQGASFGTVLLCDTGSDEPMVEFGDGVTVDLRGCTYNRFHPILHWDELLNRQEPYDRQPFTQMEETLRQSGEDQIANKVYYRRKQLEAKRISKWNPIWLIDRFLWAFTGYGVKRLRLLPPILVILLAGVLVFGLFDNTLELKQSNQPDIAAATQPNPNFNESPNWTDVTLVTFDLFVPIVDIPTADKWQPTTWQYRLFGTFFLTLSGWIFIPVGVAGLTGIMRRLS